MRSLIIFSLLLISALLIHAQTPPEVIWSKSFPGTGATWGYYSEQTSDGGYIAIGRMDKGDLDMDAWLIKTDQNGDTLWTKTYGDYYIDEAYVVKQTSDGGYILCGMSTQFGNAGEGWLLKTDSNGNLIWSKPYHPEGNSSADWDYFYDVTELPDGNFAATGVATLGIGVSHDGWIVKVDANGTEIWNKHYGEENWDRLFAFQQTTDGGFIAVGDKQVAHNDTISHDGWLVKFDSNGDMLWNKTFGGNYVDVFRSVRQTSTGGYIIVGEREPVQYMGHVGWIIKTDEIGNEIWNNSYDYGALNAVYINADGSFIAGGFKFSPTTGGDGWLIKADEDGNTIWEQVICESNLDEIVLSINPTSDGKYVLGGRSNASTAQGAVWLVKLDSDQPQALTFLSENFDTVTPPALPDGWTGTLSVLLSNTVAEVKTVLQGSAPSPPNTSFIMNGLDGSNGQLDTNAFAALVSPLIETGTNGGTLTFSATGGNAIQVGLMTDPADTSSFILLEEIPLTFNFEQYSLSIPAAGDKYIAFKHANTTTVTPLFIDDINFDQAPVPLTYFFENFDSVTPPALPNDWTADLEVLLSNTVAEVKTVMHGSAPSPPNTSFIMNGLDGSNGQLDSSAFVALISPLVEIGSLGSSVTFQATGGNPLIVGTMTDPNDTSSFVEVEEIPLTFDFEEYSVNIYTPGNTYLAFKHSNLNTVTPLFIDDIEFIAITPVELVSFTASFTDKNNVKLSWITSTETNNMGFDIEKKHNDSWAKIGFVQGFGTTTETHSYTFTDGRAVSGKNIYRLRQLDYNGSFTYSDEAEVDINSPVEYSLQQNYPNPFNPSTTINYQIPQNGFVTLKIYDMLGKEVAAPVNEQRTQGRYTISFDASGLASGVYIYQLRVNDFVSSRKMMLLK